MYSVLKAFYAVDLSHLETEADFPGTDSKSLPFTSTSIIHHSFQNNFIFVDLTLAATWLGGYEAGTVISMSLVAQLNHGKIK